jgi:hypothetical protein
VFAAKVRNAPDFGDRDTRLRFACSTHRARPAITGGAGLGIPHPQQTRYRSRMNRHSMNSAQSTGTRSSTPPGSREDLHNGRQGPHQSHTDSWRAFGMNRRIIPDRLSLSSRSCQRAETWIRDRKCRGTIMPQTSIHYAHSPEPGPRVLHAQPTPFAPLHPHREAINYRSDMSCGQLNLQS